MSGADHSAPEGGFWAICPEVPGANGQGETLEETRELLAKRMLRNLSAG